MPASKPKDSEADLNSETGGTASPIENQEPPESKPASRGPAAVSKEKDDTPTDDNSDRPPLNQFFSLDSDSVSDDQLKEIVQQHIQWEISRSQLHESHNILFLYDGTAIQRGDANRIYDAVASCDPSRKTLLIIHSGGGDIPAAYFISKLCRASSDKGFEAAIPRLAKSAATLICCGADVIHMGSMSELGPIDPQFGQIPALALKHSVEHIAQLASMYPGASEMLSSYLSKALRIESLGFYERVAESAAQYAVRLLESRIRVDRTTEANSELANRLVYSYKDHGFVIDANEAAHTFGPGVIAQDTPEYKLANTLYGALDFIEFILRRTFNRGLIFTGSSADGCMVFKLK
jgi:hypothetical protein